MKPTEAFTLTLIFFVSALYILTITHDREITKLQGSLKLERALHHLHRSSHLQTNEELVRCKAAFNSLQTSLKSLIFREELYAENFRLNMRMAELSSECGL